MSFYKQLNLRATMKSKRLWRFLGSLATGTLLESSAEKSKAGGSPAATETDSPTNKVKEVVTLDESDVDVPGATKAWAIFYNLCYLFFQDVRQ